MSAQCSNCRFYYADGGFQKLCRRNPPVPFLVPATLVTGPQTVSVYPPVQESGWCGEHRAIVAESGTVYSLHPT